MKDLAEKIYKQLMEVWISDTHFDEDDHDALKKDIQSILEEHFKSSLDVKKIAKRAVREIIPVNFSESQRNRIEQRWKSIVREELEREKDDRTLTERALDEHHELPPSPDLEAKKNQQYQDKLWREIGIENPNLEAKAREYRVSLGIPLFSFNHKLNSDKLMAQFAQQVIDRYHQERTAMDKPQN